MFFFFSRAELDRCYNFTELAVTLNELEDGVAPTDSRLRPDQRLMEDGRWDEANRVKVQLEEKQRTARKKMEQEAVNAANLGNVNSCHCSSWRVLRPSITCLPLMADIGADHTFLFFVQWTLY